MAVTQTAIIEGVVARVSSRQINFTDKSTGERRSMNIVNFLVIGDDTLAEVRVPEGMSPPVQGKPVRARVALGAYNGQPECNLDAYLG